MGKSLCYNDGDVQRILKIPRLFRTRPGIRLRSSSPAPLPKKAGMVLYYSGMNVSEMLGSPLMAEFMPYTDGMEEFLHNRMWSADPGYYHVLLNVPESRNKSWERSLQLLKKKYKGYAPAPVAVALTSLLLYLHQTRSSPLGSDVECRCAEASTYERHVTLCVEDFYGDCGDGCETMPVITLSDHHDFRKETANVSGCPCAVVLAIARKLR